MSKLDIIKRNAYMILNDLAFGYTVERKLVVVNLKNIRQKAIFSIVDNNIHLVESSLSEVNKYKSIAIIERNKETLLKGYATWESTLKRK